MTVSPTTVAEPPRPVEPPRPAQNADNTFKNTNYSNYDSLSREQLVQLLRERDRALQKKTGLRVGTQKPSDRPFDFTRVTQRKVAFKFMYLGWNYRGLAEQDNVTETVERYLLEALMRCKLIQDRSSCDFQRCGRTDSGVSALSQVISLYVRSNVPAWHPDAVLPENVELGSASMEDPKDWDDDRDELRYIHMLNRCLPEDIRIYQWSPVARSFSARFDCRYRKYRYFFPLASVSVSGDSDTAVTYLDVEAMQKACTYLVGFHDFRNFCKFDAAKLVKTYERSISEAHVDVFSRSEDGDPTQTILAFTIQGSAFLWHQVRCIMAILLLVGERKESPELVRDLLDFEKVPIRPSYGMANEVPLVLWDCGYDEGAVDFRGTVVDHLWVQHTLFEKYWRQRMAMASITGGFLREVLTRAPGSHVVPVGTQSHSRDTKWAEYQWEPSMLGWQAGKRKSYVPLLSRPTGTAESVTVKQARYMEKIQQMPPQSNPENRSI